MRLSSLLYFISETLRSLYRNIWINMASIGVVTMTLLMLGTLITISMNINYLTESVKQQVEIVLYVKDEATVAERQALRQMLSANRDLAEVRFVSREEALVRLKEQFGERGEFLEGYSAADHNPLRDSYEIRTVVAESVAEVAARLGRYPGVAEVFYGQGYVERLFATTRAIQIVGLVLMGALAATAVFLISHSIRLAVLLRRREIMIMKYVGATNWFIRWPFVLEGLLLGSLGALLPLLGLHYIYGASLAWVEANLYFIEMIASPAMMEELVKYLLPLGVGLGALGSLFSMGRYLRV